MPAPAPQNSSDLPPPSIEKPSPDAGQSAGKSRPAPLAPASPRRPNLTDMTWAEHAQRLINGLP